MPHIQPYAELSIGLAYANATRFATRKLGMHLIFQDQRRGRSIDWVSSTITTWGACYTLF